MNTVTICATCRSDIRYPMYNMEHWTRDVIDGLIVWTPCHRVTP